MDLDIHIPYCIHAGCREPLYLSLSLSLPPSTLSNSSMRMRAVEIRVQPNERTQNARQRNDDAINEK